MTKGSVRPERRNGAVYGFGLLCTACFGRHYAAEIRNPKRLGNLCPKRRAARKAERIAEANEHLQIISSCRCGMLRVRFAKTCDLCGVNTNGDVFAGSEFDLDGKVCRECRDELRDERAVNRLRELAEKPYISPLPTSHGPRKLHLSVLTPSFTTAELTLQARCRLMVIAADIRAARLSQPKPTEVQPNPAAACADCGTTGGGRDRRFVSVIRICGAKFGIDGKLCRACYQRRNRAFKMTQPLEMSA